MRRKETLTGLLFTAPWLVGSAAFIFLPMALSLYYSFTDYPLIEPPLWVGGANYRRMWDDPVLWVTIRNTLAFAAASIPLSTAVALVLAALLGGKIRFGKFYQAAVFIPTLVPLVASAMIWSWLFNGEHGLVNQLLGVLGVRGPNWLIDPDWALPALLMMSLWGVGQSVVVYVAALQEVPRHLYEAAHIDGLGPVRRFLNVTLPMLSPVILFNVVVLAINTLQVFAAPYIMFRTKDGQNPGGFFYSMYLYDNAFVYLQMGYASAMAWVLLLATLALTAIMFMASKRLVHYRAG